MRIALDGNILGQATPDNVRWILPRKMGNTLRGAPIYATKWQCVLGLTFLQNVQLERWNAAVDGEPHTVRLPHPDTGIMTNFTCYVELVAARMVTTDVTRVGMNGADITLTGIEV